MKVWFKNYKFLNFVEFLLQSTVVLILVSVEICCGRSPLLIGGGGGGAVFCGLPSIFKRLREV